MAQGPSTLLDQGRERWQKLSRLQQVALVAGPLMLVVVLVVFAAWSQQTSYGVLFSNLQTSDAAAIVAQLKTDKIPYQLADNGNAILVPSSMVDDTRLMLAGNGLPSQGVVGFEIFDKTSPLGMTDFMQQVDYQRGLEGELTRTIEQINGVSGAWVNIVLPQSSLYTQSQQDPTASIVVKMAPGMTLDPGQVKAVMHLVASAVQGLTPANVTVVDTDGVNLSDAVNAAPTTALSPSTYGSALDVEQQYEQNLSQQAMSMLSTVLGPGKAVVRVNATLNWDQLQQDSTTYGQQPGQIANQNTSTTASTGPGSTTGGPAGTGSNLVPTPTTTASAGTTYNQTQANTVYDVSQTVAHLIKAPGTVQRVTVAVFLDGTYPPATVAAIQQAVSNAIGLDSARGDLITVTAIPFNHSTEQAAQAALTAQQKQAQLDTLLHTGALALAALALLVFALRATRRRRPVKTPPAVALLSESVGLDGGPARPGELSASASAEGGAILMAGNPADLLSSARHRQLTEAEQQRRAEVKQDLAEAARQRPEAVANVILSWFEE